MGVFYQTASLNGEDESKKEMIWLFVKDLRGRTLSLYLDRMDTVLSVKQRLEIMESIGVNLQRIIFAGKQLEDSQTLAAYNVQNEATAHLVLRLRGG